jgi:hypothetical protein
MFMLVLYCESSKRCAKVDISLGGFGVAPNEQGKQKTSVVLAIEARGEQVDVIEVADQVSIIIL